MEQENKITIESVKEKTENIITEDFIEECAKNEKNILPGIYDETSNKKQFFVFQRELEEKERDYLSELVERMQRSQDRIVNARTPKEEKLTIENPQKEINEAVDQYMSQLERFRVYAEKEKLVVMTKTEQPQEHTMLLQVRKTDENKANTVIMSADGDMQDQEQEYMMINGAMTSYDIQRIDQFKKELREIDQQMSTNDQMDEYQLQNTKGLLQKYNDCKNNMAGYVNTHIRNGSIKTFPHKDLQKEVSKAQKKELQKEKELEEKKEEKEQVKSRQLNRSLVRER